MNDTDAVIPVGRDLDAVVAEKVMGWRWKRFEYAPAGWEGPSGDLVAPWRWLVSPAYDGRAQDADGSETLYFDNIPKFSTDPTTVMSVVEQMRQEGWSVEMRDDVSGWVAVFWKSWIAPSARHAPSLPEAICRAALAAKAGLP